MTQRPPPISTPCVQVCMIDGETGLCLGCFRTGDEIAAWSILVADRRDAIMAVLPMRRALIGPERFGEA